MHANCAVLKANRFELRSRVAKRRSVFGLFPGLDDHWLSQATKQRPLVTSPLISTFPISSQKSDAVLFYCSTPMTAPKAPRTVAQRSPRYQADLTLVLTFLRENKMETVRARSSNISEGGMRLVSGPDAALPVGEVMSLQFSIPEINESIKIRGVVRHVTGLAHGVEFLNLSPSERQHIATYCRRLAREH